MAFVCGCGHSGTTLVAAMLGAHPSVYAIPHETGAFVDSDVRSARVLFERDYIPLAMQEGAAVLCEKTPHHVRRIPVMRRAFPGARIVVVIRDARDVAASMMERLGSVQRAVHRWNSDNDLVRYELERGGRDLVIVSYEELIAAPEKTLIAISTRLGIDYHPRMLEFHKDERDWFGDNPHGRFRNWQIHQPLTDRRGRWVKVLSEAEARYIETECRELMTFFGYLPATERRTIERVVGRAWRHLREPFRPVRRRLRRLRRRV
jgi:hypothetical protein